MSGGPTQAEDHCCCLWTCGHAGQRIKGSKDQRPPEAALEGSKDQWPPEAALEAITAAGGGFKGITAAGGGHEGKITIAIELKGSKG